MARITRVIATAGGILLTTGIGVRLQDIAPPCWGSSTDPVEDVTFVLIVLLIPVLLLIWTSTTRFSMPVRVVLTVVLLVVLAAADGIIRLGTFFETSECELGRQRVRFWVGCAAASVYLFLIWRPGDSD